MAEATGTTPETIRASIGFNGFSYGVTLVRVAADEDAARPWRVEAPGEPFDGWYMANAELRHVQRAA